MICKFCGMDSATTEVCSWCGKTLVSSAPEVSAATPAEPVTTATGISETGVDVAESTPTSTTVAPRAEGGARKVAPGMVVPSAARGRMPAPATPIPTSRDVHYTPPSSVSSPLSSPTPVAPLAADLTATPPPTLLEQVATPKSPDAKPAASPITREFAPGDTIMGGNTPPPTFQPVSTSVSPSARSSSAQVTPTIDEKQRQAAVNAAMAEAGIAPHVQLFSYLGVFAIVLAVTGALCYIKPALYVAPMLIAMFVGTMLLPIMGVTPWAEEDSDDLAFFIVLTLVFGPLVGVVIYLVVFALRQGGNPSVLGGMLVTALVRVVAEVAAHGTGIVPQLFQATSPFTSISHLDASLVKTLLVNWAGLVSIAGWYAATVFHKADE